MSFFKSLFGGAKEKAAAGPAEVVRTLEHEGYLIEAMPYLDGGQYQIAGVISKEIGGERKVHRFVRADRCVALDDAAEMSIRKGQQIVEQVGKRMFG